VSAKKDHPSLERSLMLYALLRYRGDIARASEALPMAEEVFRSKMDLYGIKMDSKFQKILDMLHDLSLRDRL